jgi:hypothetical protein
LAQSLKLKAELTEDCLEVKSHEKLTAPFSDMFLGKAQLSFWSDEMSFSDKAKKKAEEDAKRFIEAAKKEYIEKTTKKME